MKRPFGLGVVAAVLACVILTSTALAAKPLMFEEGPYYWDYVVPAGAMCDFPVHVTGTIEVSHIWHISSFPESWSTTTHFAGSETWENLSNSASAADRFRYTIFHEYSGLDLLSTYQVGNNSNIGSTTLKEAGRVYWQGEDLTSAVDWRGRFVQFPNFEAWIEERCAGIE